MRVSRTSLWVTSRRATLPLLAANQLRPTLLLCKPSDGVTLHSPADQAWNDYWVPNCEIWCSAGPRRWQAGLVTGINQVKGVKRKGTIIQMPSIFRRGGRWMARRWDRDGDLFIRKQRGIGGKGELRLKENKEGKNKGAREGERGERETCRGFKGLMTICTAHWSGRTTLATLAQLRESYPYIWHFTSRISYLIQLYYLPAIDMHHQPRPPASSARDRCLDLYCT